MPKDKQKATPEAVRIYIQERLARDQRAGAGSIITGPDLQAAAKHLDLIPDVTLRRQAIGTLSAFEKFQALGMLLAVEGPFYKKFPEIMQEAAAAATDAERNFTIEMPAGGLSTIYKGGG